MCVLNWIINSSKLFSEVEKQSFRDMISYPNLNAETLLPSSNDTIRRHLVKLYEDEVDTIIKALSKVEGSKAGLNLGQEIQRDQRCIPSNYSSYIYTSPRVVKCRIFVM